VHYPAAGHTLSVRGSAGPWSWTKGVALTGGPDDTWTYETDAVSADTEWKPLLDDATWSRGPNYRVSPGKTVDVFPHFTTTKGTYDKRWTFTSTVLPSTRGIWVYLPPTYLENARAKFPVVYMHDGQNLFDVKTAFGGIEWQVDETMDAAAEDGTVREAIIIGVENTAARMAEYTPTVDSTVGDGGKADAYLDLLVKELKPKVDGELRTLTGREDTAIIGSSLGGLVSSYAGTTHSETFALLGVMSPSTWWDGLVILTDVAATKGKTPHPLRVYVDSGDSGPSSDDVTETAKLAQAYRDLGYVDDVDLKYVVQKGGQHNETYWAQRLPGALHFLLGPRSP
jgi:predicted alpha/beta superfamily hydrolase